MSRLCNKLSEFIFISDEQAVMAENIFGKITIVSSF